MTNTFTEPPPVIHSARTLFYAVNDESVEFTDRINLFVGENDNFEKLGEVPYLAICENFSDKQDFLLFFCDSRWEPLGTIGTDSIEKAKKKAEVGYKGITKKWTNAEVNKEELDKFLREQYQVDPNSKWWKTYCSFCGKSTKDLDEGVLSKENGSAFICNDCIKAFYKMINE